MFQVFGAILMAAGYGAITTKDFRGPRWRAVIVGIGSLIVGAALALG